MRPSRVVFLVYCVEDGICGILPGDILAPHEQTSQTAVLEWTVGSRSKACHCLSGAPCNTTLSFQLAGRTKGEAYHHIHLSFGDTAWGVGVHLLRVETPVNCYVRSACWCCRESISRQWQATSVLRRSLWWPVSLLTPAWMSAALSWSMTS